MTETIGNDDDEVVELDASPFMRGVRAHEWRMQRIVRNAEILAEAMDICQLAPFKVSVVWGPKFEAKLNNGPKALYMDVHLEGHYNLWFYHRDRLLVKVVESPVSVWSPGDEVVKYVKSFLDDEAKTFGGERAVSTDC